MKKYSFILAFGAMFALVSCGSESTTSEVTDSTNVIVDTTTVPINYGGGGNVEDTDGKEVKPFESPLK